MVDESTDVSTLEQIPYSFVLLMKAILTGLKLETPMQILYLKVFDIGTLRGQGYDGVSVMAGKVTGVSAQSLQQQPKVLYFHCQDHNLNLVISSTCRSVPEIRNLFVFLGTLTWFLHASAKHRRIFERYVSCTRRYCYSIVVGDAVTSLQKSKRKLISQY